MDSFGVIGTGLLLVLCGCGRIGFTPESGSIGGDGAPGSASYYTLGGTISGLAGTVTLTNNGGDSITTTMNTAFTFATAIADGGTYDVEVATQPSGQHCGVANGIGMIASANVTDVDVACSATGSDLGILCSAGTSCTGNQYCCYPQAGSAGTCGNTCNLPTSWAVRCDDAADCGGGSNVCCATYKTASGTFEGADCSTMCYSNGSHTIEIWCDPSAASPCPGSMTCTGTPAVPGFGGWHTCV